MARDAKTHTLGDVARAGFQELSDAREALGALSESHGLDYEMLLRAFSLAADPDAALARLAEFSERHPEVLVGCEQTEWNRLALLFGASPALGSFFVRRPDRLIEVLRGGGRLIGLDEARRELLTAVGAEPDAAMPVALSHSEAGATALRVRYRELLAELMLHDLLSGLEGRASTVFDGVAASLSDMAAAALEAGMAVGRSSLIAGIGGPAIPEAKVLGSSLAIVAMGKCGARELNVVSDVDVMFVAEPVEGMDPETAIRVATRLATETMRAIHDHGFEPPLWQVDPNLRPEGKQGALVRSLASMLAYYERWAKTWEFQALLKARPVAGDLGLGAQFVAATREMVWASASRDDFVGNVQRMRERVTEHIDVDELEVQLKLGPGGLRDIEFSVQLLQLVHGQYDERLHLAGTLPALEALVKGGFVAREDGECLASDYRRLRVLEHRLQLRELRRTALMPRDAEGLRVLARASGFAPNGEALQTFWHQIKLQVRQLHLKIFYAPMLDAVASLGSGMSLDAEKALPRLHSIGFRDPDGALRHLAALTQGNSRTARIQRNLLPVLLQWFAEGTDPDYGLLAFRRVSEANRDTPWYLRLLRDGSEAAERLTRVLSSSRFAAELLEAIPEAVAWLERDELMQPPSLDTMLEEMRSLASRRSTLDDAAGAMRAVHRREILRLALGRLTFVLDDAQVARGLDAAHTALLDGLIRTIYNADRLTRRGDEPCAADWLDLALIGMGRFGGREMGFASDIDLVAVFRAPAEIASDKASRAAGRYIAELQRLVSDPRLAVSLDFDLRPEGKNGPLVRSLDAYRAYYERWSVTWETQALLRARQVGGDGALGADFIALANEIRYPENFPEDKVREIRRMKARVEAERLPRGADPRRHMKLGPGGISDVEWLVQLLQLRHAAAHPALRTESTLDALEAAVHAGLLSEEDRAQLETSWCLASSLRSAIKLWGGRSNDSLPLDRNELEGIAGVLGMPQGHTTELEERWLAASRRARAVFEREFFGFSPEPGPYA